MRRAIRRFFDSLQGTKKYMFFIGLILICIVALCLGIYAQFFYKYSATDAFMIGINIGSQKNAEEIATLKSNFNNLFNNKIVGDNENLSIERIKTENTSLVFTNYNLVNQDENYYSVSAQIPILNINTDKAKEINAEIRTEFYDTANSIMRRTEGNTIYTVTYAAFVNKDIVSIVIKAYLKEEGKAEKVSVKTYNYSMSEERLLPLTDLIKLKETTPEQVQETINNDIKTAYNNAQIIAAEFGNLYERDLSSDIYKVENATTFFLTQDGYVYVVYAYGNNDYTNEMDIIIF